MDIKVFGNAPFFDGSIEDLKSRLRRTRRLQGQSRLLRDSPISSGSHSLDAATGLDGLPRGQMIRIADRLALRAKSIAYRAVANTLDAGGLAMIMDFNGEFSADLAERHAINFNNALVCRPGALTAGLDAAAQIVRDNAVDLLMIDWPEADRAAGWSGRDNRGLRELATAVNGSETCVLVTTGGRGQPAGTGRRANDALAEHSDLQIDVRADVKGKWTASDPLIPFRVSVASGAKSFGPAMRLAMDTRGRLVPEGDLLEAGMHQGVVERRGSIFRYRGSAIGRGRRDAIEALRQQANLRYELEQDVARTGKVGAEPGDLPMSTAKVSGPADSSGLGCGAGRYVNTWFADDTSVLPLQEDGRYRFLLQIGTHRRGDGESAKFREPDFGSRDALNLLVSLFSEDFEISEPRSTIHLPRTGDSTIAETSVRPLHAGSCDLRVVISLPRELEVLQRLRVTVDVAEASRVQALAR